MTEDNRTSSKNTHEPCSEHRYRAILSSTWLRLKTIQLRASGDGRKAWVLDLTRTDEPCGPWEPLVPCHLIMRGLHSCYRADESVPKHPGIFVRKNGLQSQSKIR